MMTITLHNPSKASAAGEWCLTNIKIGEWHLNVLNMFSDYPKYEFKFNRNTAATEFALRWV